MNIEVNGPRVIFSIGNVDINETTVNAWIVIGLVFILCLVLTHKLEKIPRKRTQQIAEKLIMFVDNLVATTMGKQFIHYAPYILTLLVFSVFGSLIGLFGLRSITADINTTLGWALMTFVLIYFEGFKSHGFFGKLKGFIEPTPVMLPLNLISEAATPISMSFRHFGNIFAGSVITILIYGGLAGLTSMLFKTNVPFLQVGIPAVLSVYFDLFSGCIQAYVFSMLTMVYIGNSAAKD